MISSGWIIIKKLFAELGTGEKVLCLLCNAVCKKFCYCLTNVSNSIFGVFSVHGGWTLV